MPKWFTMKAARNSRRADIAIFSDIGGFGITAGDFREALEELGDLDELRVDINSNGGDVFAGFAIYNMLAEHPARVTVRVQGLAASMASVVAMAGDEIEIAENGMFMIHDPWGVAAGGAETIASFAEALKSMRSGIIKAYQQRTGQERAQLRKWMDNETWFDAKQSVEFGFADRVVKPVAMAARVDVSRFKHVPASLGRLMEDSKMADKRSKAKERAEDVDFLSDDEAVDAEAVKAEARKEVAEQAKEIRALVALAGEKPELADEYIEEGKTPKEVTDDLTKRREERLDAEAKQAAKGRGNNVSARNVGADNPQTRATVDHNAIWAKWNAARKRA